MNLHEYLYFNQNVHYYGDFSIDNKINACLDLHIIMKKNKQNNFMFESNKNNLMLMKKNMFRIDKLNNKIFQKP